MSTVTLPVLNGPMTLVDVDIAEKLKHKNLYMTGKKRYVVLYTNRRPIYLHRFIMNEPKGMDVDHLDGNIYDNRRSNLRICSRSENTLNLRKASTAISGYRNVYKKASCSTYEFSITRKKKIHLCMFRSRHIAGIFADQVLVHTVGPFVRKNFQKKISSTVLLDFLKNTHGRFFKVVFSRRSDGMQRDMLCRTGVNSHQLGGTIPFNPISKGLFSVYDVQKRAYRFIPLENVICIRFAKTNYRVVA